MAGSLFTGLWRHRDFRKLWTGQTISLLGSMIGRPAISFTAILVLHARPAQLAMLLAADLVPGIVVGLFAGAWVDRLHRRPMMIAADVGRGVLLATVPLAAVAGALHIQQLYAVAFAVSLLSVIFDVAYQAYLPALVDGEQLLEANSKLAASGAVAETAGFGIAGTLVGLFTAPLTVLIDAASFFVSALFLRSIKTVERPGPRAEDENVLREIREGLQIVLHTPLLRALALCALTMEMGRGVYGTLVVLYMTRDLGFSPAVLTPIWAVGGVTSLVAAMYVGRFTRRVGVGPAIILGALFTGIAMLLIPAATGATLAAACLLIGQQFVGDAASTVLGVNQTTLRQAISPPALLGRVGATLHFTGLAAMLLGTALAGVLGELIGSRATLVCGGLVTMLAALWLALSPIRALRVVPATHYNTGENISS